MTSDFTASIILQRAFILVGIAVSAIYAPASMRKNIMTIIKSTYRFRNSMKMVTFPTAGM
jgi:hypothetical protein